MWQCLKHYLSILTVHSSNFLVWASICLYTPYADPADWFPTPDHCRPSVLQTIVFSCTCYYSYAVWVWILVECKMKYVSEELPSGWCKFKFIPDNPPSSSSSRCWTSFSLKFWPSQWPFSISLDSGCRLSSFGCYPPICTWVFLVVF